MKKLFILGVFILASLFASLNSQAQTATAIESAIPDNSHTATEEDNTDSLETDEEDEPEPDWNISAAFKFQNRRIQNGLDVNAQRASHNTNVSLSHTSGFTASLDMSRLVNPNELSNYGYGLDYVYSLSDHFDIGATLNRTIYVSDTISALAGSSANLSIYLDYITKIGTFDLSYDKFFGLDDIQFLSLSYIDSYKMGDFRLQPNISISAGDFTIAPERLTKALAKKKTKLKPEDLAKLNQSAFGITSIVFMMKLKYDLGKGFSLALAPVLNFTKDETGKKFEGEITSYLSIGYNYDF